MMEDEDDRYERFAVRVAIVAQELIQRRVASADNEHGWMPVGSVLHEIAMTDIFAVLDDPEVQERLGKLKQKTE